MNLVGVVAQSAQQLLWCHNPDFLHALLSKRRIGQVASPTVPAQPLHQYSISAAVEETGMSCQLKGSIELYVQIYEWAM